MNSFAFGFAFCIFYTIPFIVKGCGVSSAADYNFLFYFDISAIKHLLFASAAVIQKTHSRLRSGRYRRTVIIRSRRATATAVIIRSRRATATAVIVRSGRAAATAVIIRSRRATATAVIVRSRWATTAAIIVRSRWATATIIAIVSNGIIILITAAKQNKYP